jgi:hypothetical protein
MLPDPALQGTVKSRAPEFWRYFLATSKVDFLAFPIHTTLQLEIVKKWLNFNLNYCII